MAERCWRRATGSLSEPHSTDGFDTRSPGGARGARGTECGLHLSRRFLESFSHDRGARPDPIAGFLLGRRLRRLGVGFRFRIEPVDQWILPLLRGGTGLADLHGDPSACVVLGNALGQTRYLVQIRISNVSSAGLGRPTHLESRSYRYCSSARGSAPLLAPSFDQPHTVPSRLDDQTVLRQLDPSSIAKAGAELFAHQSDDSFRPSCRTAIYTRKSTAHAIT